MTWNTSKVKRVLTKPEAKLFCHGLLKMLDYYGQDPQYGLNFGFPLVHGQFERLSSDQKLTVLEQFTRSLLSETADIPVQTAINESAIYYIFCYIKQQFDDVENGEEFWGKYVLDALQSTESDEDYAPFIGCKDTNKWKQAVED